MLKLPEARNALSTWLHATSKPETLRDLGETFFFQECIYIYGCDAIALKTQVILMNGLPSKLLSMLISPASRLTPVLCRQN